MKNEIYKSLVIGEDEEDDEVPMTEVLVTEESNLFVVWKQSGKMLPDIFKSFRDYERDQAIECAVDLARDLKLNLTKSKAVSG